MHTVLLLTKQVQSLTNGLGFRVLGFGLRVQGLGFRVWGFWGFWGFWEFRGLRVWSSGSDERFRACGLEDLDTHFGKKHGHDIEAACI